jgi:hypothetical protein
MLCMIDMVLVTNKIAVSHVSRLVVVVVVLVLVCAMRKGLPGPLERPLDEPADVGESFLVEAVEWAGAVAAAPGRCDDSRKAGFDGSREAGNRRKCGRSYVELAPLFEVVWDRCLFRNSGRMGGTADRLALGAEDVLHEFGLDLKTLPQLIQLLVFRVT